MAVLTGVESAFLQKQQKLNYAKLPVLFLKVKPMNRRANEIEKEYSMNRKQKIKGLMHFFGYTRKEAIAWLAEVGE